LDLQSGNLGLKLPQVSIRNILEFGLPLRGTAASDDAKGMIVYNTNSALGEGLYVWTGIQLKNLNSSNPDGTPDVAVPVTSFEISPSSVNVEVGWTTTLSAANFQPDNASAKSVTWKIESGSEYVSIDVSPVNPRICVVTGIDEGEATITATCIDQDAKTASCTVVSTTDFESIPVAAFSLDSNCSNVVTLGVGEITNILAYKFQPTNATHKRVIWTPEAGYEEFADVTTDSDNPNICVIQGKKPGSFTLNVISFDETSPKALVIQVQSQPIFGSVIGKNGTYLTYTYPEGLGTWMFENSKEGEYSYDRYPGHEIGEKGYYYTWEQAQYACPHGFKLPTPEQATALASWLGDDVHDNKVQCYSPGAETMYGGWYQRDNKDNTAGWNSWGNWSRIFTTEKLHLFELVIHPVYFYMHAASYKYTDNYDMYFNVRCIKIEE
jgi:uncharacterized protein (TIGR02145 family)